MANYKKSLLKQEILQRRGFQHSPDAFYANRKLKLMAIFFYIWPNMHLE